MGHALRRCQLSSNRATNTAVEQLFCLPGDFVGFQGHFPGHPIVPAVVQVLMAQQVAEHAFNLKLEVFDIERAKFHRQIRPDELIQVRCCLKELRGKKLIDARLDVQGEAAAAFWLIVDRAEAP